MPKRSLNANWSVSQLYRAFIEVYKSYPVKFGPTPEEFSIRLQKLNLDRLCSPVLVDQDEVIGFILYAINSYQGKMTAYNGGTGVIPKARGQEVVDYLFEQSLTSLVEKRVERILLEVIDSNRHAIKLYERLDFGYTRTLKSFKLLQKLPLSPSDVSLKMSKSIKPEYENFKDFEPSFLDSDEQLKYNLGNEQIVEAYLDHNLVGFIIYQPHVGRISQIAVHSDFRNQHVATCLTRYAQATCIKPLTILNIPEIELETIASIEAMGFKNELNQFEMTFLI